MDGSLKRKILLVDDSRAVRQLLRLMLTRHMGLDISEAGDGKEAMEKLSLTPYDLVITDIRMPRMDGLSFIREVRGSMSLKVPIIIVSTLGGEEDRDEGLLLGADSYVTKPVKAPDLIREVADLLS